jgi:hypothetical protein
MIYIANGAPSAEWLVQNVLVAAIPPSSFRGIMAYRFQGTEKEYEHAGRAWIRNDEARLAVVEALGLKLYWLIEQNVPTERRNLIGIDGDPRYYQAVCNALADIVRDTKIIHDWREYKLDRRQYKRSWNQHKLDWDTYLLRHAHQATKEAQAWHEAASALQKLVDSRKRHPTVRGYPEIDLPEFELAPSWVYLSGTK